MNRKIARFSFLSFAAMLSLIAAGTVAIWSAGHAREAVFHGMWKANLAGAAAGLAVYFVLAFSDYRKYLPYFSPVAYLASLALLVTVLFCGSEIYGGKRWLWFFQPSEIAKVCVIAFLAQLLGGRGAAMDSWRRSFKGFAAVAAIVAVPVGLILVEPDLGTALALVPAVAAMMLAAGVWRKGFAAIIAAAALASAALLGAVYEAEKPGQNAARKEAIERYLPLKPHQIRRVKTFLFPESDPLGAGYNYRQSVIAIGSGGFSGRGIGKAQTNALQYLPQSVSLNDFIFCVFAEETGFVGSLALIALFATLCLGAVHIAYRAEDPRGRLLALGLAMLVFAHVYINMAMSIGLLPVTGLPLPFISSGRTFLLAVMASFGLIQSVSIHKGETT